MPDATAYLPPLVGAVVGVLLKWLYDLVMTRWRFRQELKDNDRIDVSGEWYAAWQTSVDGEELVNTEHLLIRQRGKTLKIWNTEKSPENPRAGYLWEGQMQFLQGRNVMGWYFPREEEHNASKGILYLTYLSPRKTFFGKWVGSAYDGELITGCVVIAKDRSGARLDLEKFAKGHSPADIRLISYSGLGDIRSLPPTPQS